MKGKKATRAEVAEWYGVTTQTIMNWEKDGLEPIEYNGVGAPSFFSSLDVDEYRYDKRAPKNISEIDGETYDKTVEEARLKHHQANNEALKEAETVGQILNAGYVVEMCGAIVANARARMLVIHNTIKNRFPEADQEIIDETERAIIEALNELGKDGVPDSLRKSMDKYSGDMDGPA